MWCNDLMLRAAAIAKGCDIVVLHEGGGPPFLYSKTAARVELVDDTGRVLLQQPEMDAVAGSADGMAFICAHVADCMSFVPDVLRDPETIVLIFGHKHYWPALLERPVSCNQPIWLL